MPTFLSLCLLLIFVPALCLGWYGQITTVDDLTVTIEEVAEVTQRDQPVPVTVTLDNKGAEALQGTAEIRDLVDDTRVVGEAKQTFTVPAAGKTTLGFQVAFGKGTYSALYPVHVYIDATGGGRKLEAHAVRIVSTKFEPADELSPEPTPMEVNFVPERGALMLWTLRTQRVAWQYYDGPMQYKPAGWLGTDPTSSAHVTIGWMTRGDNRAVIQMHPPWKPGGGTVFCDYLLKLPDTKPLKLTFANAIRDNTAMEPPSDGVLFRVWVAHGTGAQQPELLYEKFTDAKVWVPGEVDLSRYAGQTILLRLESHPGPNKDTTCDSCFWAEPMVVAGQPTDPGRVSLADGTRENVALARRILSGQAKPDGRLSFILGEGEDRTVAVFKPTRQGLLDGILSLVGARSAVSFEGLDVQILGRPALRWPTSVVLRGYEVRQEQGRAVHVHKLELDGKLLELTATLWTEGAGLRIALACPERLTDFALGAADQEAPVVYYGHGYRIVNPKGFRAGFGGHNLSTSHVGCDFAGGLSLLQAVDVPPDYFEVSPQSRRYALHSHMNGTLTLVPSEKGAFDCAIKYRPLYDKKPAGGVQRLAGRFCFDIWGGKYRTIADQMAEMIRYGLTDSFLTVHVWQRWGYDYRLPDIWPPNPDLGTIEDMCRIGQVCDPPDIPWGLHDNYIDFYPDATGYTYNHICFTADGQPIKAWFNEGRDAQSYRWRPDAFMLFLQRNLKLIKEGVKPSHYFIDVFTSAGCFDFYDREGKFHPSTETRQKWGEAFAWIRDYLGNNAPTTSEAGHDQLTGWLDGADCQHLSLSSTPEQFTIYVPCEAWERVPWYDAVNHSRFILHGVGYSGRYEGGQGRLEHGINSDDYISAEILTGHALMTDAGSWGRPAVRKYWLAQDVARNLALKEMTGWEMVGGDMGRQIVTWSNGTKVYVNRGKTDWEVEGHVLPQYGYLVLGEGFFSAIEKRDGVFCESSVGPSGWYCDARTYEPDAPARISVRVEGFRYLGDGKFSWDVVWKADQPAPRDLTVFTHFYSPTAQRRDKIAFQDDHKPSPAPTQWAGTVRYTRTVTVPEDAEGEYQVGIGLYDDAGRLRMSGLEVPQVGGNALWLGTLTVRREGVKIADISFKAAPEEKPKVERANPEGKSLDFGFTVTNGAFRVQKAAGGLRLVPLPGSPAFAVSLRLAEFGLKTAKVATVTALDADGRPTGTVAFQQEGEIVSFRHDAKSFCYEVSLR